MPLMVSGHACVCTRSVTTAAALQDGASKPAAPSTGQGSLATYKELCTLATSLGQPRLLYALIDVAAEATPSAARRGAALGLHAESTDASRAALQPHVPALLPLLYRASYAPRPLSYTSAVCTTAVAAQGTLPHRRPPHSTIDVSMLWALAESTLLCTSTPFPAEFGRIF